MSEEIKPLWEILVPTVHNNGKPFRRRFHKVWDAKVQAITGGLTIYKPAVGIWVSGDKQVFSERMIPVRIAASREEIEQVADVTAKQYEQLAVAFYLVSPEMHIVHYDPNKKFERKK